MADGGTLTASVFVSDVNPLDTVAGRGGVFANGEQKVQVDGIWFPNALAFHPSPGETLTQRYDLKGVCNRFVSLVALNDDVLDDIPPVIFRVYTDDKLAWESGEVTERQVPETCDVDITGCNILTLSVALQGETTDAHAVWLEPIVQSTLRQVMQAVEGERKQAQSSGGSGSGSGSGSGAVPVTANLRASVVVDEPGDEIEDGELTDEFLKSFSKSIAMNPQSEESQLSETFMRSFKSKPLPTPVKPDSEEAVQGTPGKGKVVERTREVVSLIDTFKKTKIASPDVSATQSADVVADLMETIDKTNSKLQEQADHVNDADTSAIFVANELAKTQSKVQRSPVVKRSPRAGTATGTAAAHSPAVTKVREQTPSPSTVKASSSPKLVITDIESANLEPVDDVQAVLKRAETKANEKHWEDQFHGITCYRRLAKYNPESIADNLEPIVRLLAKQAGNLRSTLARHAVQGLGDVLVSYSGEHRFAHSIVLAATTLVLKGTTKNKFVLKEINVSLDKWIEHATFTDPLNEIVKIGSHKNPAVRALACRALARFADEAGVRVHLGSREVIQELIPLFAKFLHERLPAAREAGKVGVRAVRKCCGDEADAMFKAHCSEAEYREVQNVQ